MEENFKRSSGRMGRIVAIVVVVRAVRWQLDGARRCLVGYFTFTLPSSIDQSDLLYLRAAANIALMLCL